MRVSPRNPVVVVACVLATAAQADSPSLCQQVAAHVWRASAAGASLAPDQWIVQGKAVTPAKAGPRGKAAYAAMIDALKAKGEWPEDAPGPGPALEYLPGTGLYMGRTIGGTANCESSVFALVDTKGLARVLPNPDGYTLPCWNMAGELGLVLGHPA